MKVSDITTETVQEFLRLDESPTDISLAVVLAAASAYVIGYTGLTADEIDTHEDISIAVLVICSDMYDNRQLVVESNNVNKVAQSILDMHCVNLL